MIISVRKSIWVNKLFHARPSKDILLAFLVRTDEETDYGADTITIGLGVLVALLLVIIALLTLWLCRRGESLLFELPSMEKRRKM